MKISFLSTVVHYFKIFHEYAGDKLYVLCGVILLSGLFEGIGISLLLPVLNIDRPPEQLDNYTKFIFSLFNALHIQPSIYSLLTLLFFVFLLKGIFFFLQNVVNVGITTTLAKNLRLKFCQKYALMNYQHYVGSSIGYLNNVVTTEVERGMFGFSKFIDMMVLGAYIIVYTIATLIINWKLTLVAFGVFGVLVFLLRSISVKAQQLSRLVSEKNAQIQSLLIQIIYNFKYLKATDRFRALYQQLTKQIEQHRNYQFQDSSIRFIPPAILEPVAVLFLATLIIYQVAFRGQPISEIFILLLFFYRSFNRLFGIRVEWQKFCSYVGGVEVLRETEIQLDNSKEKLGPHVITSFNTAIELKNVNFSYGSKQILHDVQMKIPHNKTIGIVGESGAGKTTVFDVLAGLITPQSGQVLFDGKDYKEIDLTSLRALLGYVTQEPVIFNDTVANNISFWQCDSRENPCRQAIADAAVMAHCEEFIKNAENGYETMLGDKGIKLSVGQRQRVAIARELFKDPQIILFDEATSALDTASERLIQQSIESLAGKRTMVIVAHRLSTVKACDYIYVLHQGKVVEEGTFVSLTADKSSRFSKMCAAQSL
jgi:subfamily B ATP-binding cassette protein MsbA